MTRREEANDRAIEAMVRREYIRALPAIPVAVIVWIIFLHLTGVWS